MAIDTISRSPTIDRDALATALPEHRFHDADYRNDHAVCLARADAILRRLTSRAEPAAHAGDRVRSRHR